MADNLLAQRASEAFAAIIAPVYRTVKGLEIGAAVPVIAGENAETRAVDHVACNATREEEYPIYSGNYWVMASVQIQTNAMKQAGAEVEPAATHLAMVSAIINALDVDDLDAQLTAASDDFTVFTGSIQRPASEIEAQQVPGAFRDTLNFKFLACASDLS